MAPFLVRLKANTRLAIGGQPLRLAFADEQVEVSVFDVTAPSAAGPCHSGLELRLLVQSEDPGLATTSAIAIGENVCNLLSASHGAGVALSEETWTIDLDEAKNDRTLVQRFTDFPTRAPALRQMDYQCMALLTSGWSGAAKDPATRTQVGRAMWHLRRAGLTDDLVEQFRELWLGLECTNSPLTHKYGLPTRFVARKCERCDHPMEVVGSSAGVVYALTTLAGFPKAIAKQARTVRQSLLHGLGRFYEQRHQLPQIVPALRDALALAIADLLNVPAAEHHRLRRQLHVIPASLGEVLVQITLFNLPVARLLEHDVLPAIHLSRTMGGPEMAEGNHSFYNRFRVSVLGHNGQWGNVIVTTANRADPETPQ